MIQHGDDSDDDVDEYDGDDFVSIIMMTFWSIGMMSMTMSIDADVDNDV